MKIIEELKMIAALNLHDTLEDAEVSTIREAADLLEEALKALEPFAEKGEEAVTMIATIEGAGGDVHPIIRWFAEHGEKARAILTKSQGEKIDG